MKRCMFFAISFLFFSGTALCQDLEILKSESGFVALKNNVVSSSKGQTVFFQNVAMFLQTRSPVGIGGDFTYQPKGDYVEYAPYLTFNNGPHYALIGLSSNSASGDYLQAGYWHINKYAGFNVVLDSRAYVGVNDESNSFLDNFLEVTHFIAGPIKAGFVIDDVYSLAGRGNTILVGSVAYVEISKSVKIFGRYLHGWQTSDEPTSESDKFRLGIQYSF